jgi:hypothetical protein
MNKFLLLLFLLPGKIFCQTDIPKNADGNYEYTGVVNVDSASADKLYSNAKLFIVDAFKSGKDVTQMNDDVAKTVAGKGDFKIYYKGLSGGIDAYVYFKIIIQCKDGRYKYTINHFEYTSGGRSAISLEDDKNMKHETTKNMKGQVLHQVNDDALALIDELHKHMASNPQDF